MASSDELLLRLVNRAADAAWKAQTHAGDFSNPLYYGRLKAARIILDGVGKDMRAHQAQLKQARRVAYIGRSGRVETVRERHP